MNSRILSRFACALALAATSLVTLLVPGTAQATPILVADASTGRVLYAKEATDPWYPASVTKLMTAYLVLGAVRDGRLQFDTPLTVSARASAVIPSKMGFKPGIEVTVDNALKMMLVKSANDMAVTLAEGVGGSIENFSDMMNAAAYNLGMRQSHFANPHGLPDERNRTSARDLAVLARAILREFPQYSELFGIGALQFGKRTMRNTNGLIGRYPGADGMKTGFICSSGFNVVATATHGSRRLIVVVLGARSGAERTLKAAALFDRGFADSGWGGPGTLDTLPISFHSDPPDMREQICGGGRGAGRGEEEAETAGVAAGQDKSIFALFGSKSANAGWETPDVSKQQLGPRVASTPVPVFVGRTAGAMVAEAAARKAKRGKGSATAFAPDEKPGLEATEGPRAIEAVTKPVDKAAKAKAAREKAAQDKAAKGNAAKENAAKQASAKPGSAKSAEKANPAKATSTKSTKKKTADDE